MDIPAWPRAAGRSRTLAFFALSVFAFSVTQIDRVVRIAPGQRVSIPLRLETGPARLESLIEVTNEGAGVKAVLLTADEAKLLEAGQRHKELASTGYVRTGRLRAPVDAGDYAIVLENTRDQRHWAVVRVRIEALRSPPPAQPTYVPRRRQAVIIALSFAFFFSVVAWAGARLRRSLPRLRDRPPPME